MKRLALLALCCAAPIAAMGAVLAPSATALADDEIPDSSFVQITLIQGDLKIKHPGYDVNHGEQTILEVTQGDDTHEFDMVLERKDGKGPYSLMIKYRKNGRDVHAGQLRLDPKKSKSLSKGDLKIEVNIDPNGGLDKSRRDKIDGPDSDDPL